MSAGPDSPVVVELSGVAKGYGGLRPLRIERLALRQDDRMALLGFDAVAAEMLINLITAASLPDSGRVAVFGRDSADVSDATAWLSLLDRFGIVSARAVLLDAMTALQNLAMPFTLDVEPLGADIRARAEALASEAGLPQSRWLQSVGGLDATAQMQIRLGRALALDPVVLLLEHASAGLDAAGANALAASIGAAAKRRGIAVLSIGVDESFARALSAQVLRWEPGTGRLGGRRGWFGGRLG